MLDTIHRLKHWQLFIPLILPTLLQYGVQFAYMDKIQKWQLEMMENPDSFSFDMPDISGYSGYVIFFILLTASSYAISLLWMWSVGKGLEEYLPEGTGLKIGRFKAALIAQALGYGAILVGIYYLFNFMAGWLPTLDEDSADAFFSSIGPEQLLFGFALYLLAMLLLFLVIIYSAWYVGKTLKSIELGRPAKGGETIGYLILTVLLFIGIWMLQPKINRLVETGTMEESGQGPLAGMR